MKYIILLFALVIGCLQPLHAQQKNSLSIGFESNSQFYTDDNKTGTSLSSNKFRSNNYLKVDYSTSKFLFGIQLEGYESKALLNYSTNLDQTNFSSYYAGFKSDLLEVRLGYFYEQFGSGLILRSWEDRQLGINNSLRGIKVKFQPKSYLEIISFYAKQKEGFHVSDGNIFGLNKEININEILNTNQFSFNLGFSYVGRSQTNSVLPENKNLDLNDLTHSFSGRLDYSKGNIISGIEYIHKSSDAIFGFNQIMNVKSGGALLINLGYNKRGLGTNITLRRVENMSFYSDREATGNIHNDNIINYVPALTKQHDYLLTNIYVYQSQPLVSLTQNPKVGEIGGQFDIFYKVKKNSLLGGKYGTNVAINISYWAGLKAEYDLANYDYQTKYFNIGEKYYTDASLEIRKKWNKKWNSILYYVNQYYNKGIVEGSTGDVRSNILIGESIYKMPRGRALRFELQHLWTKDDAKNWAGGTLEFNLNSKLSFYVNDIYNYGNDENSEKIHYYNLGTSYVFGPNRISVNYGRQRGGLLCVGGVCRYITGSSGISASLVLAF